MNKTSWTCLIKNKTRGSYRRWQAGGTPAPRYARPQQQQPPPQEEDVTGGRRRRWEPQPWPAGGVAAAGRSRVSQRAPCCCCRGHPCRGPLRPAGSGGRVSDTCRQQYSSSSSSSWPDRKARAADRCILVYAHRQRLPERRHDLIWAVFNRREPPHKKKKKKSRCRGCDVSLFFFYSDATV